MENITTKDILNRVDFLAPLESQEQYRQEMASFIRMHLTRVKAIENGVKPYSLPTVSMLIVAETGCGKTYVASQMAKASGVNFITIDCSTLARSGWKGVSLPNAILSEREKCKSRHKFDRSIILFDETDKLRLDPWRQDDGNPQPNFLRMFGGELQAESSGGNMTGIDTSKMSFIFAGAFSNGLDEIIKRRLAPKNAIGFAAKTVNTLEDDVLKHVSFRDIQDYGIMGELCGRIGSLLYLPPLTNNDYRTLIKGEQGSALLKYKNLFGVYGIDVDVTDEVCDFIASKASKSGLGARSINSVLFLNFQKAYEAIEERPDINKVVLEMQDTDVPGLCFEFGERKVAETNAESEAEPERLKLDYKVKLPDINFSFDLHNEGRTLRLISNLMDAYYLSCTAKPDIDKSLALRAFLDCTLCYLKDNVNPDEMTLTSIEKLTKTTKKEPGVLSTFDTLIENGITAYEEANDVADETDDEETIDYEPCQLEKKYREYRTRFKPSFHEFLVDSV